MSESYRRVFSSTLSYLYLLPLNGERGITLSFGTTSTDEEEEGGRGRGRGERCFSDATENGTRSDAGDISVIGSENAPDKAGEGHCTLLIGLRHSVSNPVRNLPDVRSRIHAFRSVRRFAR